MFSSNQIKKKKPFPKRKNLDPSKLKEFADDNSKFDENGRKLSKRVENTVGKKDIAHYEHFPLFLQFSKDLNSGLFGKGLITFILSSANAFKLDQSKNCRWVKG